MDGKGNQIGGKRDRQDVGELLQLAAKANIQPEYQEYDLADANQALLELGQGKIHGAKVLYVPG